MNLPPKATQPTMYFIGVTTSKSSIMKLFPLWADAGHDYGKIEIKGYRKLIVEQDGKPEIIDNPKWK